MRLINFLSSDISLPNAEAEFFKINGVHYVDFAIVIKASIVVIAIMAVVTVFIVKTIMANRPSHWNYYSYQTHHSYYNQHGFFVIFSDLNRISNKKNVFQNSKELQ